MGRQQTNSTVGLRIAKRARTHVLPSEFEVVPNGVRTVAVLPNPAGKDPGNEQVTIANLTTELVNLDGWMLIDKADNEYLLSDSLQRA